MHAELLESSDLLSMDQSPAKKARTGGDPTFRLEHFVIKHDPAFDYEKIAESLFDGPKYMVQGEHWTTNAHVHVQGLTSLAERTFENKRGEIAKNHFSRKLKPGCKPVQHRRRGTVNEIGFQYMMKEGHAPLFHKGFTEEELEILKVQSEEHVKKMKTSMQEYVKGLEIPAHKFHNEAGYKDLFYSTVMAVDEQLDAMDKKPTRYTTKDVAQGLRKHPHVTPAFVQWMYETSKF